MMHEKEYIYVSSKYMADSCNCVLITQNYEHIFSEIYGK